MHISDRISALTLAAATLLVFCLPLHLESKSGHLLVAAAGLPGPDQDDDAPPPSTCSPEAMYQVGPESVPAGETVAVTLSVSAGCPDRTPDVRFAVVVDSTADRGDINAVKSQVSSWINLVLKPTHPNSQVSIIEFAGSARRVCAFTNDREAALDCVNRIRLGSGGASKSSRGIKLAVDEIVRARPSASVQGGAHEAFMLWTNAADEECSIIEREAQNAARRGIRFGARCISAETGDCEDRCLAQVHDHSESFEVSYMQPAVVAPIKLATLRITTTFPSNIEYVARSAWPSPSNVAGDGSALSWHLGRTTRRDFRMRLRPLEEGLWPPNDGPVESTFVDEDGGVGTIEFEVPTVRVLPAIVRPTQIPTATAVATAAPSPTPTATLPEPSATPANTMEPDVGAEIYLPRVVSESE